MEFKSKAQTLRALQDKLTLAQILPVMIVRVGEFAADKTGISKNVINMFSGMSLIVRSSCASEDTSAESNAGKYQSILDVHADCPERVEQAITSVIESYNSPGENEEVLVQPFLKEIAVAGVVFTCDISTGAPYYVVNYSETADTTAVTAGSDNCLKTFIAYKRRPQTITDPIMDKLLSAVNEIESVCENNCLDIEFGIGADKVIYIFQVRPITNLENKMALRLDIEIPLLSIYKKVEKLMRPYPFLCGETTCFGVMPDWNPAEILGSRPKKLAVSLYKELVTDSIWAHQRNDYGYRDLTSQPLMATFCGIPYIDVRVTFNSFIPRALYDEFAEKLASYYIKKLKSVPSLHDKVEFDIVFSCYYFGLPNRLRELKNFGFNENEIKRLEFALLNLTNNIIDPQSGFYKRDMEAARHLRQKYERIINSDIGLVDKIYWLLEICKTYGTLPFAGIARAAFIAVQFLSSMEETDIISKQDRVAFMRGIQTVGKTIAKDRLLLHSGAISKQTFIEKYGHIRPDTYNICSERYADAFDDYFSEQTVTETNEEFSERADFSFSSDQMKNIGWHLDQNGLLITPEQLVSFIKGAIEGREYVKFAFTKALSEILQLIRALGKRMEISNADLAHLDISLLKQLYVDLSASNLSDLLNDNISANKKRYEYAKAIRLPDIILSPNDVYSFTLPAGEPNFITGRQAEGEVLYTDLYTNADYRKKIVFIQSADPGYDFLFTKNIAGLVTEYGGANSHMAIRCAEMGIPAVIGAGQNNFEKWKKFKWVTIDCLNHTVNGVK
jgi:phosphohistidine swiveling domain-containing protein